MTTTLLPPLFDPKVLTSPGAAISARQMMEDDDWRIIGPIIDDMLEGVYADAVEALGAAVLIAAGGGRRNPFAYTNIMRRWTEAIRLLSERMGTGSDVVRILADSDVPHAMYEDARALLVKSREEGMTDYQTKVELRKLLVPPRPGVGMPKEQASYRARIRMLARTASTRTFNSRQMAALADAGVKTKMWVTRRDAKVRLTHSMADGDQERIDVDFIVGGYALMYPGDPKGPPHETVNCRCVIITPQQGIDMPIHYGVDVQGGQIIEMGEGAVTEEEMARIAEIPVELVRQETDAAAVVMSPRTNGQIQSFLRHPRTNIPHLPTRWVGDRGLLDYEMIPEGAPSLFPGRELTPAEQIFYPTYDPQQYRLTKEGTIHAMDALIDRVHTVQPTIGYRGFVAWGDMQPGDEFLDKGYTSVTNDFTTAREFAEMRAGKLPSSSTLLKAETYKGQPLIATIKIPTDTPIALGDPTVYEFILPRDSRFRVVDVNPPYVLLEKIG